ncbi:MAG: isopenicillin N synthase family oxygenase [Proteobacteria bacterium]|nr:isopenicillin N synthase family oxygenase [Pseudomonadota bacterium]
MKLEPIDYQAPDRSERFVASLVQTGFAILTNHPISESLVNSIYQNWQTFFASEEKQDYLFHRKTQDGFYPAESAESARGHSSKDIKEYYHYYPWGQCPAALKTITANYYESALTLAVELLGWIELHSPPEVVKYFSEPLPQIMDGSEHTLLRILHYPPLTGAEDANAIRAAAHEDINLLTVLPAANEPGLQVLSKEGEWLDVSCDFNTLIINTGDMLKELSQDYFPSTTHRVVNPEGVDRSKSRISLPLFLQPRKEVVLSDRYTADSYLQERLEELGNS